MWVSFSPQQIQQALTLSDFDGVQAQHQMSPVFRVGQRPANREGQPRLAAVMALVFPSKAGYQALALIRRTEHPGDVHGGQMSFPGGRRESHESFEETARRETFEEIGLHPNSIQVLGELTQLYVPPSDFEIHPFVGYIDHHPTWQPDTHEVAEVVEMPLYYLFEAARKRSEIRNTNGLTYEIRYYDVNGHKVWGATAIMLSEFEGRLRVIAESRPE
jgi:8-oxo-dGTP pyrophosphatase MutT (NUDIX family)